MSILIWKNTTPFEFQNTDHFIWSSGSDIAVGKLCASLSNENYDIEFGQLAPGVELGHLIPDIEFGVKSCS